MRERSYLTPGAQAVAGGIVLIACLVWPSTIFIVGLVLIGRFVSRARHGGKRGLVLAIALITVVTLGLGFLLASPGITVVLVVVGMGAIAWLLAPRVRPSAIQV
jgi:hypothetical protein